MTEQSSGKGHPNDLKEGSGSGFFFSGSSEFPVSGIVQAESVRTLFGNAAEGFKVPGASSSGIELDGLPCPFLL